MFVPSYYLELNVRLISGAVPACLHGVLTQHAIKGYSLLIKARLSFNLTHS